MPQRPAKPFDRTLLLSRCGQHLEFPERFRLQVGDRELADVFGGDIVIAAEVFAHACRMGLEGIVSKLKDSRYISGRSLH